MYAEQNYPGTAAMEDSYIALSWVYVRTQRNAGIRTAQVHRGHRAPVQPPRGITPVPVRAIRAETCGGSKTRVEVGLN